MHFNEHFMGFDVFGSGEGGEEFLVSSPSNTWAEAGEDPAPAPAKMMDEVYGKRAAEANYAMMMNCIAADWADTWEYDKDLSLIPGK
jgi:hypothetical protein